MDQPSASTTLGIAFDGEEARFALVKEQKNQPNIIDLFVLPLGADVKPLDIDIAERIGSMDEILSISGVEARYLLVRPLEVPLSKEADIDSVLPFQAEPLLPYPVEETLLDRQIVLQKPESSLLSLFSVRQNFLLDHLEQMLERNLEPEVVSCVPAALAIFAHTFNTELSPQIVLHIGMTETTCVLASDGKVLASHFFEEGYQKWAEAAQTDGKSLKEVSFETLDTNTCPHLARVIEEFCQHFAQTLLSLGKQAKEQPISSILITGLASLKGVKDLLAKHTSYPIVVPHSPSPSTTPAPSSDSSSDSPKSFPFSFSLPSFFTSFTSSPLPSNDWSKSDLQTYAVPIGLALGSLSSQPPQVNFRQEEFVYPHPWRRYKKHLATYFILCLVLAFSLHTMGNLWLQRRAVSLKQEYIELLPQLQKTPLDVEKEYDKSLGGKGSIENVNLNAMSSEAIMQRINFLEKQLQNTSTTFSLHPNVPLVSDVLAWICSHPNAIETQEEQATQPLQPSQPPKPLINIESFNYTMVRRPEQKKLREHYQVKVEFEFSTETPRQARELHDALIAPNPFIDPKADVKWSSQRGRYKASFFLKDRTSYPLSTS